MKYLPLTIILFTFFACKPEAQPAEEEPAKEFLRHVGDIPYDAAQDTLGFEPCHEDAAFIYYNFGKGITYKGEKAAILRKFDEAFRPGQQKESGYITIRFMINCKGEPGRFRLYQMDENYVAKDFSPELVNQLFTTTRSLNEWEVPADKYGKDVYDYYQYLTFKINNGQIERILP